MENDELGSSSGGILTDVKDGVSDETGVKDGAVAGDLTEVRIRWHGIGSSEAQLGLGNDGLGSDGREIEDAVEAGSDAVAGAVDVRNVAAPLRLGEGGEIAVRDVLPDAA
jgi:hypothetical protein